MNMNSNEELDLLGEYMDYFIQDRKLDFEERINFMYYGRHMGIWFMFPPRFEISFSTFKNNKSWKLIN